MKRKIKANSNPTTRAEALKEIENLAERKGYIIPDIDIDEYESLKSDFVGIASNIEFAGLLDSDEIRRAWNSVGWGEYADDDDINSCDKIMAADNEEKKMSLEDIAQEKLDNVEDDFDYVLSGIERLCREDMCQEAIAILENLSSTLNGVISEIGDNFVEDIPEGEE